MTTANRTDRALIWDLPLRLVHWGLALCVTGSWVTAELATDYMEWHMPLGYASLGLVCFRLIWGFVGPRHARFGAFLAGPARLWTHARALLSAQPFLGAGHTPLGGWMALALIVVIGAQASIGLFITDDVLFYGPYNAVVSGSTAGALAGWHHTLFDVIAVLVVVHVAAVIWYAVRKGQNLAPSMISGRKAVPASEGIAGSMLLRAAFIALAVAAAVTALVQLAPPPPMAEYYF